MPRGQRPLSLSVAEHFHGAAASSRPRAIISTSALDRANTITAKASRSRLTAMGRVPSVAWLARIAVGMSDGRVALIAVADAYGLSHFVHEDFAIADFPGARGGGQRSQHLLRAHRENRRW